MGDRPGRRELESLRRSVARVAGEVAAFIRDRVGAEELLNVVTVHDGDEGMRVDIEAERMVIELLKAEGIGGVVVTEESGVVRLSNDPYVVVVDPLDGSKNYASAIPWCSTSIAILPAESPNLVNALVAAVAPVPRMPVVSMGLGIGVYEGNARVAPSTRRPRMLVAYVENPDQAARLFKFVSRLKPTPSIRALGSSSLEIVWAALGRLLVFIDLRGKLRVYDVAAAAAIAREAGAKVYIEREGSVLEVKRVGTVAVTRFSDVWNLLATSIGLD
jgi:myo-inositol-1(or 4)-monophosphatase